MLTAKEGTWNAEEHSTLAHCIPAQNPRQEVPHLCRSVPASASKLSNVSHFCSLFPRLTVPLFPHWALRDPSALAPHRPPLPRERAVRQRSRRNIHIPSLNCIKLCIPTKISPIAALFKEKELNKEVLYFSFLILR